jgi:hypothetical protein
MTSLNAFIKICVYMTIVLITAGVRYKVYGLCKKLLIFETVNLIPYTVNRKPYIINHKP